MNIGSVLYSQILAVVFAVLFVCTFFTLLSVRRHLQSQDGLLQRLSNRVIDGQQPRSVNLPPAVSAVDPDVTSQLAHLKAEIDHVSQSQLDVRRVPGSPKLDEAAAMARQGIPASDIAQHFSLPKGEAELLVKLHRPSKVGHSKGV